MTGSVCQHPHQEHGVVHGPALASASLTSSSCQVVYLIFKRFEPVHIHQHFWLLVFPPALLAIALLSAHHAPQRALLLAYGVHWGTILAATLLYRASPWHPLASYPGPFAYRLSKLALAWATRDGTQWLHVKALHDRYGDIVRIGASRLPLDRGFAPSARRPGRTGSRSQQPDARVRVSRITPCRSR